MTAVLALHARESSRRCGFKFLTGRYAELPTLRGNRIVRARSRSGDEGTNGGWGNSRGRQGAPRRPAVGGRALARRGPP